MAGKIVENGTYLQKFLDHNVMSDKKTALLPSVGGSSVPSSNRADGTGSNCFAEPFQNDSGSNLVPGSAGPAPSQI